MDRTTSLEPLLRPEDVAAILKVKTATVYQMRKRGLLTAVDLGLGAVRFRREDIEALIEKRQAA
jgi:excisionase family DNA binding protein